MVTATLHDPNEVQGAISASGEAVTDGLGRRDTTWKGRESAQGTLQEARTEANRLGSGLTANGKETRLARN